MYGECLKAQADRWVSIGKLCDKEIIASNLDDAVSVLKDHMRDLSNKLGSRVIVVVALVVIKVSGRSVFPEGKVSLTVQEEVQVQVQEQGKVPQER